MSSDSLIETHTFQSYAINYSHTYVRKNAIELISMAAIMRVECERRDEICRSRLQCSISAVAFCRIPGLIAHILVSFGIVQHD